MAQDGREAVARHLIVSGTVQGVGYREWAVRQAHALGVAGWVRNLADGRVEAVVEGDPAAVAAMVERCRAGPAHAAVTAVEVEDCAASGAAGFERRPSSGHTRSR